MFRTPTYPIVVAATLVIAAALLGACAVVTLAPGADQVRVTNKPAEVAGCKAVGNIQVPKNEQGVVDMANAMHQFRNQAVGLGANAALVTEGLADIPATGVAYRCP